MICFLNINRCYHLSRICLQCHYDTLGISKNATHAEVKSAYYKLSMRHHPDRQDGNREKFEKITDAYKVLGDVQSRKLYDRGAFQGSLNKQKEAPRNYYSQTAAHTRRPDIPSGRNPIYDFDMWSRLHYGATMERRREAKARYDYMKDARSHDVHNKQKDNMVMFMILTTAFITCVTLLFGPGSDDFDKPPPVQRPTNQS